MSYKKGMSKARFKATMRMFWTERWKYERTPEEWVQSLSGSQVWWSTPGTSQAPSPQYISPYGSKSSDLLFSALDKLVLEKKLNKLEGENMKKMIAGTPEDAFIALTIMATLKPKKFKRTPKNTETNE
jgi:hypothetical protein